MLKKQAVFIVNKYNIIVQFLKNFFLKFRNKLLTKGAATVQRKTLDYAKAQSVGILFGLPENGTHQAINAFVSKLAAEGKQVEALSFFERQHHNPYQFKFDFFTHKDIDFTGQIKSEVVQKFIAQKFDYLFCIAPQPLPELDYILLQSKALCRVGVYDESRLACFELMISTRPTDELNTTINTMLNYTKTFTKNG